ncbi:uncharacterized protein LOC112516330 [Cynara cardunculus var. scolymus]|uniref:uncharacterized protein LOC112516330 n=1 Tax=Cynara cardunculus var. scolymus TaxID=59895 RepID=UPI000D6287A9|nr:uncharacterized protein LOC112516330 [Cynara cardunculus var. scolymus]
MVAIVGATMGLLSAVLGFVAEATKVQLADVKDVMETGCTYPTNSKNPTQVLGVVAVMSLLISRVCFLRSPIPSPVARLSLISSWLAWLGALIFYIVGLVMIGNQGEKMRYGERLGDRTFQIDYVCKVVNPGIFGAGASLTLTSVVLQIIYLVVVNHHDGTITVPPSTQRSEVTMV